MVERVAEVRQIAKTQAERDAEALRQRVREGVEGRDGAAAVPEAGAGEIEGFLFPATYEFTPKTTSEAARRRPDRALQRQLGEGRPRCGEEEEPDALRRADHRVDGREGDDRAGRAAEGRGRDLQPAQGPHAARDRRDDPLRARRPRHRIAARLPARERQPVQHAQPHRAAADADRESGSRLDAGRRAPGEGRLPLLRAQAGQDPPLLHGE